LIREFEIGKRYGFQFQFNHEQFALHLPESLKQAAKRIAAVNATTMNQFFVVAIAEKISAMETAKFFEQRAELAATSDARSRMTSGQNES